MTKAEIVGQQSSFNNLYRSGKGELIEMVGVIPSESQFPFLSVVHRKNGKHCIRFYDAYGTAKLGNDSDLNIVTKIQSSDLHLAIKLVLP